ncbi:hypothetical protein DEA8626_02680 [Defluviimonas aquaemixtae]|uniref:Lipopolysaccharide export system protein LptC n=1 Tax=Albidovulum aquaemixtae TaxID=1542388 RepID=A0A2R8BJR8_9RHOB|nr:LPS export ABC transporter periplasmic protein LptC [Defluviimonas aquaemixtae]SPH23615.1 hypothetical protein DEA8626_02680 [Defluviimonas aquaemixtae]
MADDRDITIHSRVVFWLKIILPLFALAILSTLFLLSRRIDTDAALPYARVDVEALARDPRLTAPEYLAVTEDGAAVSFTARTARTGQGDNDEARAEDLVAVYETPGGLRIDIRAREGEIDRPAGRMRLSGDVEIVTSTGYRMLTAGLDSALDRTNLRSDGEVQAEAPYGQITAGQMEIRHEDVEKPGYLLDFKTDVKLIYEPQK